MSWLVVPLLAGAPAMLAAPPSTNEVTLPLTLRRDLCYLSARAQETNVVLMLLDTGFEMTMINPARAKEWDLQRSGQVTIAGIAGRERADTFRDVKFSFEQLAFQPDEVAALPSDRRRRRDGILGSDFFGRFVVEIDTEAKRVHLHEPATYRYTGAGEIVPLQFPKSTPIIEVVFEDEIKGVITAKLEIDTGCDGALCLGADFLSAHPHLRSKAARKGGSRGGVGGGAEVESGTVAALRMGKLRVEKPSANFFNEGNPAGPGLAGHTGMELLRNYRVIFDYTHQRMILEEKTATP